MTKLGRIIIIIIAITIILVAGIISFIVFSMDSGETTTLVPVLKLSILPADSNVSASGICADVNQKTNNVVVIIHEDGPSPRCQQINLDQIVILKNNTSKDIRFSLGKNKDFSSMVLAGGEYTFPVQIGELLALGVHEMVLDQAPYIGPELWVIWDKNIPPPVSRKRAPGEENTDNSGGMCAQVITRARNIETGEEKDFHTPCDVPVGWEKAI
ncbi:MAG: hypothetical protein WC847_00075 [Candidatus Paceibacterota bacterium]|jgi:hypothetical protein